MADFNGTFGEFALDVEATGDEDFAPVIGEGAFGSIDCRLSSGGVWGGVLEMKLSRLLTSRSIGGGVLCRRSRADCGGDRGAGFTIVDSRRLDSENRAAAAAVTDGNGSGISIGAG